MIDLKTQRSSILPSIPPEEKEGVSRWRTAILKVLQLFQATVCDDLVSLNTSYLGKLTADPSSPVEGDWWYNTTTHLFKGYNGTNVVNL